MTLDPQKFFIGLMDFFSILLPGALLAWLLMDEAGPVVLGLRYVTLTGVPGWALHSTSAAASEACRHSGLRACG